MSDGPRRPLFDAYVVVDWSASSVPKRGADSIWIATLRRDGELALANPSTRVEAMEVIAHLLAAEVAAGRRVLAGFDFPFGYPEGAAGAIFGREGWQGLWSGLSDLLEEGPRNASNRFEVADRLNALGACYWGHPQGRSYEHLTPTKPPAGAIPEFRVAERYARGRGARPLSVWQLAYTGGVGSQTMTGLPALQRLREDPRLAGAVQVWPFETGLEAPLGSVTLAEVYPSLIRPHADEPVKDAGQVRALAEALAALDGRGRLVQLFQGPADLSPAERRAIEAEEAWILGLGFEDLLKAVACEPQAGATVTSSREGPSGAPAEPEERVGVSRALQRQGGGPKTFRAAASRWLRDPAEIYRRSFEIVRAETRLERFEPEMAELAVRVVHACGDPSVADRLAWSKGAAAAGRAALAAGAPVICDAAMVAKGVIRRGLPAGVEVISAIDHPGCGRLAASAATTRSAAAMDLHADRLGGAVVAVGNAPTALFRLLELIDEGAPRPALILGFPVGFVGAAESKAALAADPRGVPFVTLRGRKGGSAMAAAAVNALALGLDGDGLARPEAGR